MLRQQTTIPAIVDDYFNQRREAKKEAIEPILLKLEQDCAPKIVLEDKEDNQQVFGPPATSMSTTIDTIDLMSKCNQQNCSKQDGTSRKDHRRLQSTDRSIISQLSTTSLHVCARRCFKYDKRSYRRDKHIGAMEQKKEKKLSITTTTTPFRRLELPAAAQSSSISFGTMHPVDFNKSIAATTRISSSGYKPSSQFQFIYWRMLTIREISPREINDCL